MKKLIICWLLSVVFLSTADAQYRTVRTGYEGDFFSLEGALDLFKQSHTLRDFERKLNTQDNWVNNLDLDYDGRIDYIRVEHRRQGNFHAIILQALVGRYDVQDVAVIEMEVIGRGQAILQIVGDEGLYGEEVIVEPVGGYSDSRSGYHYDYGNFVNVYYWQPVRYLLGRQYVVYVSPYRWQYYPAWWSPWAPCAWSVFRPRIVIYHRHYHIVHIHRVVRVHHFYRPYRSYSHVVVQRTNKIRVKHGKPPIQHSAAANRRDSGPRDYRSRKDFEGQQGTDNRSTTPGRSPAVSRKSTTPSGQSSARSRAPQAKQPSRSTTTRSRTTTRSTTPGRSPAVSRKSTTPSGQSSARSRTPQVKQPSRSSATRSRATTRSTAPARKPSASSRTTSRPSTVTRSKAPAQKPSASSRRATPASKPKAAGGNSSKSTSSRRKGN